MKKRTVYGITIAVLGLAIAPLIVFASINDRPGLDPFLARRAALFAQLDRNVTNVPKGFEHVFPPREKASFPANDHIERVVQDGKLWEATNWSSYELRVVEPLDEASAREVLSILFRHLSNGLNNQSFVSRKSGGPDLVVKNRSAFATYWHDSGSNLIVTLSVIVDMESGSAHATRYVHERF